MISSNFEVLNFLNSIVDVNAKRISEWIENTYNENSKQRPLYSSVDIRNAGFKAAPVDTNLFPSGFNNIDESSIAKAQEQFKAFLESESKQVKNIAIYPENFTRNKKYFENLINLKKIFSIEGINVTLGSTLIESPYIIDSEEELTVYPIEILESDRMLYINEVRQDAIILNNDLSSGVPPLLSDSATRVVPSLSKGWHSRSKHRHFSLYNELAFKFGKEFGIDPWLISSFIGICDGVNFRTRDKIEDIAALVDDVIYKISEKYAEYNIKSDPYTFIKADNGTFGVGIMVARSGEEVLSINKKKRHSMDIIKGGLQNNRVIIQEGIPTIYSNQGVSSENIVYLMNGKAISFVVRNNQEKDVYGNLNTKDAYFSSSGIQKQNIETVLSEIASLASTLE